MTASSLLLVALVILLPLFLVPDDEPSTSSQELASTSASPTPPTMEMMSTPQPPSPSATTITAPPSSSPTPPPRSSIVLAIIPDSQYTVEGAPYIFRAQVEWLRAHHAALGRPFVVHVGDVVQGPSVAAQWKSGAGTMALLVEDGIDHSVSSGNHDVRGSQLDDVARGADEPYLRHFGAASARVVGGRDDTGWSEYHVAKVQGVALLVLATDWRASDGTVAWARGVLAEHPTTPAMLVSHEFLSPMASDSDDPDAGVARTAYGDYLWHELVAKENQIFMVVCGHIDGSGWREDANASGERVLQLLVNYQEHAAGGNGHTRLMELDFSRNSVQQFTFSPWVQTLWRDEGAGALAPHDVAILNGTDDDFVVSMNFTQRFAGIGAAVPAELTQQPGVPWLDAVRLELGEVPLPSTSRLPPVDVDDYPVLPETVAHWRFDGISATGQPVPADALILDLSGNGNHLLRRDTAGGLADHLTTSSDSHPLSAGEASLCFANPDRSEGGYLATIDTAPLNHATFVDTGYTIEAFVKLPLSFLDDSRPFRWTGVVARAGRITDVVDKDETQGDTNEPLAVLGLSNLAEMQFASWPAEQGGEKRKVVTAWSSPLSLDTWYHVAAVNDGNQTRLFVDGWPARRDPVYETGVVGLASAGQNWLIGASFWGDNTKVFGGCLGELHITARALTANEFLLSRR